MTAVPGLRPRVEDDRRFAVRRADLGRNHRAERRGEGHHRPVLHGVAAALEHARGDLGGAVDREHLRVRREPDRRARRRVERRLLARRRERCRQGQSGHRRRSPARRVESQVWYHGSRSAVYYMKRAGQAGSRTAGYAMAALLVAIAVMGVAMTVALPAWRQQTQREKEEELIFRGRQYVRAVQLFQRKYAAAYPPDVDLLVRLKFLRKKYTDPMVKDGEFEILYQGSPMAVTVPVQGRGGAQAAPTPGASGAGQLASRSTRGRERSSRAASLALAESSVLGAAWSAFAARARNRRSGSTTARRTTTSGCSCSCRGPRAGRGGMRRGARRRPWRPGHGTRRRMPGRARRQAAGRRPGRHGPAGWRAGRSRARWAGRNPTAAPAQRPGTILLTSRTVASLHWTAAQPARLENAQSVMAASWNARRSARTPSALRTSGYTRLVSSTK